MDLAKEIRKIVEYQNSQLPYPLKRTEQVINSVVTSTLDALKNHTYDFSRMIHINLNQDGKRRKIKIYRQFSSEEILCVFIKRLLDRKYHIEYPNRNDFMRSLFDVSNSLKDMLDYTIYRFDFADFFNSVSASYVFEKCIYNSSFERWQSDLIKEYTEKTRFAYAGLNTSNILCEIIAQVFDEILIQQFDNCGLIYYRRYIDDGILIFNQYIEKDKCTAILNDAIQKAFYDNTVTCNRRCRTKLNQSKLNYIAKRLMISTSQPYSFDFLGYLFELSNNPGKKNSTEFRYGLTQSKIDKYQKRINELVYEYASNPRKDIELLRHQIKGFSFRTVYQVTRYKTVIWKSKGLISNYGELGSRLDKITPQTERFLKNAIIDAFKTNGLKLPYFLRGNPSESCYNLYHNLKKNKTLLFVQMIGIQFDSLKKLCRQVGIATDTGKTYDGLVRDYLIKIKVGH